MRYEKATRNVSAGLATCADRVYSHSHRKDGVYISKCDTYAKQATLIISINLAVAL